MGSLVLTPTINASPVSLTSVGITDWAEYAVATVTPTNTKSGGGGLITLTNPDTLGAYSNDNRTISWTADGTPNGSGSGTNGIFDNSGANPFTITFPASPTPQRAFVYLAYFDLQASLFTATLSDGSASPQSSAIFIVNTVLGDGVAQIDYSANSPGQSLICTWIGTSGSSYNLQAAALQPGTAIAVPQVLYHRRNRLFFVE